MRESKTKISFFYKFLSSKFYLTEIPVENKRTILLHWFFWRSHAKDTMKIIRTGSCITLLSDFVPMEAKTFFRMLYFEDYAKYVENPRKLTPFGQIKRQGHYMIDVSCLNAA